jgi:hypothetical protein
VVRKTARDGTPLGVTCPSCGHGETSVKWTRYQHARIRRRRICERCKVRFDTVELILAKIDHIFGIGSGNSDQGRLQQPTAGGQNVLDGEGGQHNAG